MPTHAMPELYARWVAEMLPGAVPDESRATCGDCAMCVKADGMAPVSVYFFQPDVKCCVYMPRLPNFLVGRILGEDDGPGRRSVEARIAAGIGVTPRGLERPPAYELPFRNTVNAIGRSKALRCPHFVEEGGLCGIWKNRDAQCSTWFCRHERGPIGMAFWAALRDLLTTVERELALWAAREEGVSAEVLARSLPEAEFEARADARPDGPALDGIPDPQVHAALWGAWAGREREFYAACARRVDALSWDDVLRIGGIEVGVRAEVARMRWDAHADTALPERLSLGRFEVVLRRPGGMRVVTYSSLDAIDLPDALMGLLPLFDGRPLTEVREQIRASWNVELDDGFLRHLVDWGILVADPRVRLG